MTPDEVREIFRKDMQEEQQRIKPEPPAKINYDNDLIKELRELSRFLKISLPKPHRLKNMKGFPHFQNGRVIYFFKTLGIEWLQKQKIKDWK